MKLYDIILKLLLKEQSRLILSNRAADIGPEYGIRAMAYLSELQDAIKLVRQLQARANDQSEFWPDDNPRPQDWETD